MMRRRYLGPHGPRVAIDRANLNTPNREGRTFTGFIHWDADTSLNPLPIGVQGVLSLADTDNQTGGFQCVPELSARSRRGFARSRWVAIRSIPIWLASRLCRCR